MIGTSPAAYVFIRGCIFFLHNIAPVSLVYSAFLTFSLLWPALGVWRAPIYIEIWLVAEAVFFIAVFIPQKHYLQRPAIHPERLSSDERTKLFERCNSNVQDPEKYLSRWLLGAKEEHIKRENVKEFLRWAFFNGGATRDEDELEIEGYVRSTEKLLGREIPSGRGSAKVLRLTLDKVDGLHRSLLWYLCIVVVDSIMFWTMSYNGFHLHRTSLGRFFTLFPFRPLTLLSAHTSPVKHLTYWHRPHASTTRLPVLFVHGIGVGLYPYTNFLRDLNEAKHSDVGIIALEIMPISSRITHPALEKDVMINEIRAIVQRHGWEKFVLVSHSYGSVIVTQLLKSPLTAPLIGSVVLIDPVSFLLHLPDVAYNFTARLPVRANEYQMWYFGSKDLGVAHTLARRFFWNENILWKEDLGLQDEKGEHGRDVTVVLSGKDLIVDTPTVRRYLTAPWAKQSVENGKATRTARGKKMPMVTESVYNKKGACGEKLWTGSGLEVLWFEDLDHAQVFDSRKTRRHVTEAIMVYSTQD